MLVTPPSCLQRVDSPWTLHSPPTICLTDGSVQGACGHRSFSVHGERFARPLISDHESPTHTVGPDGTLSVQGVAGPGARGHWRDGYNVVGAGDSEALGEASSTLGGYLALGALRRRARAMAGDAGRALRTLAAAVADGVGRAMTAVEGLRDGRRGGRVRWRPRFGDG